MTSLETTVYFEHVQFQLLFRVMMMARNPGIYVEILIRGSADEVWQRTQIPGLHELWDLRFTAIEYLPRASKNEPQRFRYSTRIGFGVKIEGEGESTTTGDDAAKLRTSALKFWSSDRKSLIKEGSGYWRYIPVNDGIRFLTWYDYRTRWGALGAWVDRLLFRPLIGWATAWSFDRLRLWIDREIPPRSSLRMALIHAMARMGIFFVWLWQGLMPKLLFPSVDERLLMTAMGVPRNWLAAVGVIELALAFAALLLWRWRPFFLMNIIAMAGALVAVAVAAPPYLVAAFNPVTLNAGVILLSFIGYLAAEELPSASQCLRRPRKESE
ncbi:MAG TPA: DoxX-like family protein [Candidatus Angelobacter sp.]|nr:DoxX-like family protein [Candidatus Angelobacter sp.]